MLLNSLGKFYHRPKEHVNKSVPPVMESDCDEKELSVRFQDSGASAQGVPRPGAASSAAEA